MAKQIPTENLLTYSHTIKGWREIGAKKYYFRSKWEMNYARYLQYMLEKGWIVNWEYATYTFWFDKIKRGIRSYTPDFRVWRKPEEQEFHEVKGYMTSKDKTKIERMKLYYPEIKLYVVDKTWFRDNEMKMRLIIRDWE